MGSSPSKQATFSKYKLMFLMSSIDDTDTNPALLVSTHNSTARKWSPEKVANEVASLPAATVVGVDSTEMRDCCT
jgi:hypothetical protein